MPQIDYRMISLLENRAWNIFLGIKKAQAKENKIFLEKLSPQLLHVFRFWLFSFVFQMGKKNGIDTPGSIFSCFVTSKADSYFSVIFFMVVFWQFLFPLFEKKSKSTIFYVEYKFLSLSILLKRHLFIRFFFLLFDTILWGFVFSIQLWKRINNQ